MDMHFLGVSSVVWCSSLLFLVAQETHKSEYIRLKVAPGAPARLSSGQQHLPPYMMHLYRSFNAANQSVPPESDEQQPVKEADTVRSVMAKSFARSGRRWIATFDFSSILADEKLQMAELRIRFPKLKNPANYTVEIHHNHEYPCQRNETCHVRQQMGFFSASSVVNSSTNWKVYNVTNLLLDWLNENIPSRNITLQESKKEQLLTSRGQSEGDGNKGLQSVSNRALLVVFTHVKSEGGQEARASLLHTAERSKFLFSTENKEPRRQKRHKGNRRQRDQPLKNMELHSHGNLESLCRKVDLQIDFNQIGWGSWIISPKKYNAYRCEGACPSPVGEDFKPTNHAYMQSLLKHYHPDRVPSSCCVPSKMSPLSMLYYENGGPVLRHHEDMIVDECGCH